MLQMKQKNYRDGRIKLYQQAIEDRNASYERLIENEDALRRAANFDKKYGTNYVKTYTKQLQNYAKRLKLCILKRMIGFRDTCITLKKLNHI